MDFERGYCNDLKHIYIIDRWARSALSPRPVSMTFSADISKMINMFAQNELVPGSWIKVDGLHLILIHPRIGLVSHRLMVIDTAKQIQVIQSTENEEDILRILQKCIKRYRHRNTVSFTDSDGERFASSCYKIRSLHQKKENVRNGGLLSGTLIGAAIGYCSVPAATLFGSEAFGAWAVRMGVMSAPSALRFVIGYSMMMGIGGFMASYIIGQVLMNGKQPEQVMQEKELGLFRRMEGEIESVVRIMNNENGWCDNHVLLSLRQVVDKYFL